LYNAFLSERTRKRIERSVIAIAIGSFLIHLALAASVALGWYTPISATSLLLDPIASIYTPFSFVLLYEVYLLVFYLPSSITVYVGKQYEIITLIIIRKIFKDISGVQLDVPWFSAPENLQLTYDIATTFLLFGILLLFYRSNTMRQRVSTTIDAAASRFIQRKRLVAALLAPTLFGLALFSLIDWFRQDVMSIGNVVGSLRDINEVFFDQFFTILIFTHVLLLLLSLFYSDRFRVVIRNSMFVISTILIRLSFDVDGLTRAGLIVSAVAFGWIILVLHNQYERMEYRATHLSDPAHVEARTSKPSEP
jgi:hypothetical protein